MENDKIIIILLCILAATFIVGVAMFSPSMVAKEGSNLTISDKELLVGDSLVVKLTDSNGNPLSNKTIKINLLGKDGTTINKEIITDSNGNAKLKMQEKGEYLVDCDFSGDELYASSSITDDITVDEATTKVIDNEETSTTTRTSKYAPDGSIYPEYGPEVDRYGKTREFAIANNWHYVPLIVDGEDVGGYTAIDPTSGTYHS